MRLLKRFRSFNILATLYFNFKMLKFKQALKLPFIFNHKVRFENISGKIILKNKKISRGIVKIGARGSDMFPHSATVIDLKGIVVIDGHVDIGHGCLIRVDKKGVLSFGNNVTVGAQSKIFCVNKIVFKNQIDISWECQVFDTNFHYLRNRTDNSIEEMIGEIEIGSYNWLGNRITVMKNTKTPKNFTVASNSLCNKSYTDLSPFSIIGGYPAKLIGSNKERIFEKLEGFSIEK